MQRCRERVRVQVADPGLEAGKSGSKLDPIRFGVRDAPKVNPDRMARQAAREFDDPPVPGNADLAVSRRGPVQGQRTESPGAQNGLPHPSRQEVLLMKAACALFRGPPVGEGDQQETRQ